MNRGTKVCGMIRYTAYEQGTKMCGMIRYTAYEQGTLPMNRGQRCVVWLGMLPMNRVHCLWTGYTAYEQGTLPMSRGFRTELSWTQTLPPSSQASSVITMCCCVDQRNAWPVVSDTRWMISLQLISVVISDCAPSARWELSMSSDLSLHWLCTVSSVGTFCVKWPVTPLTVHRQFSGNFLCQVTCHSNDHAPSAHWELSVSSDLSLQWPCTISSLGTFCVKWHVSPRTMHRQLVGNFPCQVTCHSKDHAPSAHWELSVSSDMSIQGPCTISSLGTFRVKWPVTPMTMHHQLIGNFPCQVTCHSSDHAPSAHWELPVSSDLSLQWPCTISSLGTFRVKWPVSPRTMHRQLVGNFPCRVTCQSNDHAPSAHWQLSMSSDVSLQCVVAGRVHGTM